MRSDKDKPQRSLALLQSENRGQRDSTVGRTLILHTDLILSAMGCLNPARIKPSTLLEMALKCTNKK